MKPKRKPTAREKLAAEVRGAILRHRCTCGRGCFAWSATTRSAEVARAVILRKGKR